MEKQGRQVKPYKNNATNGFVRMEFVDDSLSQKGDIASGMFDYLENFVYKLTRVTLQCTALESLSVRELDLPTALPKQLEQLIESIGRTGIIEYKWAWLSKLFRVKIHQVKKVSVLKCYSHFLTLTTFPFNIFSTSIDYV